MRMKGKKVIFNRKDTWNLNDTLSPVIAEGLKKFKEVVTDKSNCAGCPGQFISDNFPELLDHNGNWTEKQDGEFAMILQAWYDTLDKMIYAFDQDEPDIELYDFTFNHNKIKDVLDEDGKVLYTKMDLELVNEQEHQRYKADCKEHEDKVQEGLELTFKYYTSLLW